MKTMRNALNITADNHELVKAGYIHSRPESLYSKTDVSGILSAMVLKLLYSSTSRTAPFLVGSCI